MKGRPLIEVLLEDEDKGGTNLLPPIKRLAALVAADGRTQRAIAEAAGMKPPQLAQTLLGRRLDPSINTVSRILDALGKSWRDLDG